MSSSSSDSSSSSPQSSSSSSLSSSSSSSSDSNLVNLNLSSRLHEIIRQTSIRTIYEAAVEIITNSDDAYRREGVYLKDIKIFLSRNSSEYSTISFVDQACGMSSDEMQQNLLTVGGYTATDSSRGMMGRGAKDCSFLGDITFTSIKNGKLSQLVIYQNRMAEVLITDQICSEEDRKNYSIHQTGTNVTLKIPSSTLPDFDTFYDNLRNNIFLRNLFTDPNTIVLLCESPDLQKKVEYSYPERKLAVSCDYDVPGYNTKAHLEIYRSETEIPFRNFSDQTGYGILVCSDKGIYECSALYYVAPGVQNYMWSSNIRYISGILVCNEIEKITRDAIDFHLSPQNPFLLLDPNRRNGLVKDHPFTAALYSSGYQLIDIIMNRIQDTRDDRLLDNGNASDVLDSLNDLISNILPPEDVLYTWRTKKDTQNLIDISSTIQNVNLDSDFLGLTWEEIQKLANEKILQISGNQPTTNSFKISFTNDPNVKTPYQILYLPGKIGMKINLNDPSIREFVAVNGQSVNLVNAGKALTVIGGMTTEATTDMIVRRNIMTSKTSVLDMDSFTEYNTNYNFTRQDIAPNIYSSILSGISSIKSAPQPLPLN